MYRNIVKFSATVIVFLMTFAGLISDVQAVEKIRETHENGGRQIWIETGDFDRRDEEEHIKKVSEADPNDRGEGYLAENSNGISINVPQAKFGQASSFNAVKDKAFVEYDFTVDKAGPAFGYVRVNDLRPDGEQSLWIALNVAGGGDGLGLNTQDDWAWLGGKLPADLVAGKNSAMIAKREGDERGAVIVDIVVISTVEFRPTDDLFKQAAAIEPQGKLAVTWGNLKAYH